MGLDMYLSTDEYVGGWDHMAPEQQERFNKVLAALGMSQTDVASESPSLTVKVHVAYWRKANAIHNWFVKNCQDGVDECQEAYVSRENLEKLLNIALIALAHYEQGRPEQAAELLPPASGFFFGSTAVDEWYAEDLKNTVAQLDRILTTEGLKKHSHFIYQSSW